MQGNKSSGVRAITERRKLHKMDVILSLKNEWTPRGYYFILVYTNPVNIHFRMPSDWLLKLGISCDIHWFAKHSGRVHMSNHLSSRVLTNKITFFCPWLFTGLVYIASSRLNKYPPLLFTTIFTTSVNNYRSQWFLINWKHWVKFHVSVCAKK